MKRYLLYLLITAVAVTGAFADDGALDDSFSFDETAAGDDNFGGFGDETAVSSEGSSSLAIAGKAIIGSRLYTGNVSNDATWEDDNSSWSFDPELSLDLTYEAGDFELFTSVNVDDEVITDYSEDILDEAYVHYYGEYMDVTVGKQTVVWGKGDEVHVIDLLNPKDYTDYLNPDYLDRQIAQNMVKIDAPVGMNGLLELAYVPVFEASRLASEGIWMQNDSETVLDYITAAATNSALAEYTSTYSTYYAATGSAVVAEAAAAAAMSTAADTYGESSYYFPEYDSLSDGQFGVRYTTSFAGVDLGAVYYYGFNRLPSVVLSEDPTSSDFTVDDIEINYDRIHAFGFEAGTVLAGFNLRGEGAYYMSEDLDGDDAEVINGSLNYVAGFDRNLPVNNLNINLQFTGTYILNYDNITSAFDVEYGDEEFDNNMLLKVSDSYNHEKIKPEVSMLYDLNDESGFIRPAVDMEWDGQFSTTASATIFWGDDDSVHGQFDDNDFVTLEATYRF